MSDPRKSRERIKPCPQCGSTSHDYCRPAALVNLYPAGPHQPGSLYAPADFARSSDPGTAAPRSVPVPEVKESPR